MAVEEAARKFVWSSRNPCPLPAKGKQNVSRRAKSPPPDVPSSRTFTAKPLWQVPLIDQQPMAFQYTPDELQEMYEQRAEEAQLDSMFREETDQELVKGLLEENIDLFRCDCCDTLFDTSFDQRCPNCNWPA